MGRNTECRYTAIAKRRENIPKTRRQRLADEKAWLRGWLYVENYKPFGATATEAQGDKAGKAHLMTMEWSIYTVPQKLCDFCV